MHRLIASASAAILLLIITQVASITGQVEAASSSGRKTAATGCDRASYSFNCLKLDTVQFLDKLSTRHEYQIAGGLSLLFDPSGANQTQNTELIAEMARSYPNDPQSRLNGFVLAKVTNFLRSHTLNIKLLDGGDIAEARSAMETGRKKDKDKKGGLTQSIVTAALMMKSMLMALALGALALLAGKALVAALMALLLAAISALKALTSGKQSTTYEIITKPAHYTSHSHANLVHDNVHEHSGGGGGGGVGASGYGRSMDFALPEHLATEQY